MSVNETHVNSLREALAARRVIVILGAGVSAATTDHPTATSWIRLIESGLSYVLLHRPDVPEDFESTVRTLLAKPDYTPGLITAADLISTELGAPSGADFRDWLRLMLGEANVDRPELLDAIVGLGAPIATVNYDTLVEKHTQRVARTWRFAPELQSSLSGLTTDIAHLHGCWTEPESVVFGGQSYGRLVGSESAQALEKAVGSIRSLLFIGCGDGLTDPNFATLLRWLEQTYPESSLKHYRLCRTSELDTLTSGSSNRSMIAVAYGDRFEDLPAFVRSLSPGVVAPVSDAISRAKADILEHIRTESVFADQLTDINVRSIEQLIVPPVILPVTHEQYAAAQRDEDGPKISRVNVAEDLRIHDCVIIVGDESAGLTTTLQWLVDQAQDIDADCAPLIVDFRGFHGMKPLDRAIRIAIRQTGASIGPRDDLPLLALGIDNVAPSDRGEFPRLLSELPMTGVRWFFVGCRPGSEAQLDLMLRGAGLRPVTRYLGRMNTSDIKSLASLVAPQQADKLADKAVRIIQQEHLARTPLTVCLLVSVLLAGEALLSTASETALLDAYVSLLLGRGSAYDDARFILDSHDNSSLLGELARRFVELDSGAVEESVAIATFEEYFDGVGWTESASEALNTLVRRHVLVRRNGRIAFAQASLLHLFAAKKAVFDTTLKQRLLGNPLFYSEIIKHYTALTRNDRDLVVRADELIKRLLDTVGTSTSRSSAFAADPASVVTDPEELDSLLTELEKPILEFSAEKGEDRADGADKQKLVRPDPLELHEEDWVPFPLSPVEDMPPLVRLMRTLTLASNILRDSEEVRDLELKRQVLGRLLKLWGVMVDAFASEPGFSEFLQSTARTLARESGLTEQQEDRLVKYLTDLGPLLTSMSGMTLTLSSRKLALTLTRVLDDPEMTQDFATVIMGALLCYDIHHKGWSHAFHVAQQRLPFVRAVDSALYPLANYDYYYGNNDTTDLHGLEDFIGDHVSLRAGRRGTKEQKKARGRVVQNLKRNRLQLSLQQARVPPAIDGGSAPTGRRRQE